MSKEVKGWRIIRRIKARRIENRVQSILESHGSPVDRGGNILTAENRRYRVSKSVKQLGKDSILTFISEKKHWFWPTRTQRIVREINGGRRSEKGKTTLDVIKVRRKGK